MSDDLQSQLSEFRQAMSGVEPLRDDRAPLRGTARLRSPRMEQAYRRAAAEAETQQFVDGLSLSAVEIVESEQELLFASPGVQVRQMKKLRRGHIPWQAGLDLHGYRLEDARDELSRFIRDCAASGLRCVLVVHGKSSGSEPGTPALIKSHVNDWLRQLPQVVAFCSCAPQDGGTGALYVLLRQKPSKRPG
jgi:DNA-nicking Smr family endonuclease